MGNTIDIDFNEDIRTTNERLIYNYYKGSININTFSSKTYGSEDSVSYHSANINYYIDPNIFFSKLQADYHGTSIFVSKPIHKTSSPSNVGELIIKHDPVSNTTNTLFTCFLIKVDNGAEESDLDKLLKMFASPPSPAKNIDFDLSTITPNNSDAYYYNYEIPWAVYKDVGISLSSNKIDVIVFGKPIRIKSASNIFENMSDTTLSFLGNEDKPHLFTERTIIDSSVSYKGGEDQIYIDCNPTGESNDTIATYNVPINSEYTNESGKINFQNSSTNMVIISVFVIIAYFFVPWLYKLLVIEKIIKLTIEGSGVLKMPDPNRLDTTDQDSINEFYSGERRLQSADIVIVFIILLLFLYMLITGFMLKNWIMVTTAIYFIIFSAFGGLSVMINRLIKKNMTYSHLKDGENTETTHILHKYYFDGNDRHEKMKLYDFSDIGVLLIAMVSNPLEYGRIFLPFLALIMIYYFIGLYNITDEGSSYKELGTSSGLFIMIAIIIINIFAVNNI